MLIHRWCGGVVQGVSECDSGYRGFGDGARIVLAVLKVQWGSHPDRTLGGPLIFHGCYRSTISMFVRLATLLDVCPTAALVRRSLAVLNPWKAA